VGGVRPATDDRFVARKLLQLENLPPQQMALARGVADATLSRGTALLRLAGRCSYEIYLTHMFVVFGLIHLFRHLFGAAPAASWAYPVTYAIMLALSILLGYAVERLFSNPVNEALRDDRARRAARLPESSSA
jgi:peptidoglycan/LPS O-acetylase OafA/YrhL